MRKTPRAGHFWLDFTACFLIPCYTLLFAGSVQWFGTNFSVIAVTGADHYRGFVYWGLLAIGYFFVVLVQVGWTLPLLPRAGVWALALAAGLALSCALAIPYLPQYLPRFSALHVVLAAGACALLMMALLTAILAVRRRDREKSGPLLRWWLLIVAGSGALFAIPMMVSTALEVFFTITSALLARRLWLVQRKGA